MVLEQLDYQQVKKQSMTSTNNIYKHKLKNIQYIYKQFIQLSIKKTTQIKIG